MLPEEKACSLQYIFQIKLSLTMAGRKVKEKVPKPRTGDGLMMATKWRNYLKKKKTVEQGQKRKVKDRVRYLLKKQAAKTICSHEKKELKLLQIALKGHSE